MKKIAIIGAGLSGLLLADKLSHHAAVTVFEKARGVGGRCSTRMAEGFAFDHGAQCFTARTADFNTYLQPLLDRGVIAPWRGPVINLDGAETPPRAWPRLWEEEHYVCAPKMNSWCSWLAENLSNNAQIMLNTEVAPVARGTQWHLTCASDQSDLGMFDWLILTAPPEQTRVLLGTHTAHFPVLEKVFLQPCHAVMVGLTTPLNTGWIGARVHNSPLKWISIDSSKPGRRTDVTSIVAHSDNDWAKHHLDADPQWVESTLLGALARLLPLDLEMAPYKKLHRWKYAVVGKGCKSGPCVNHSLNVALTSDWAYSSRLEEVWQAAQEVAAAVVPQLSHPLL